jgi:FkbM family methyltransferase
MTHSKPPVDPEKAKPRIGPWARLRRSLAWKLMPDAQLKLNLPDGIQLQISRRGDLTVFNEIILGRLLYQEIFALIPKIENFVDLGCNSGFFSAALVSESKRRGWDLKRGLLIDAEQESVDLSRNMLRLNSLDRFEVVRALIGQEGRKEVFTISKKSERSGAKYSFEPRGSEVMTAQSLARLTAEHQISSIDLLKIDIEGSEKDLLENEPETLESASYVILEWHAPYCTGAWVRDWILARNRKVLFVKTVLNNNAQTTPWDAPVGLVLWSR